MLYSDTAADNSNTIPPPPGDNKVLSHLMLSDLI